MTTLNGYIQGLGGGERRTVDKTGKGVKLSVFENIDDVIVFNQVGETTQKTLTGKNLFKILPYANWLSVGSYILEKNILPENTNLIMSFTDNDTSIDVSGIYFGFCENSYSGGYLTNYNWCLQNGNIMSNTTNVIEGFQLSAVVLYPTTEETYNKLFARYKIQIEAGSTATDYEEYCGGVPSPNPDYPQEIKGIGVKQLDGTYKVSIDYWDDDRDGRITASGLAYPLYEGDVLDFANGKVIRANGYKVFDGSENWIKSNSNSGNYYLSQWANNNSFANSTNHKQDKLITLSSSDPERLTKINICYFDSDLNMKVDNSLYPTASNFKTFLSNNPVTVVYLLKNPVEEYITIEGGDISDIGTARVEADGTLTVKYDKVEMAIRKYSSPPDWSKIGYTETPSFVLDAFDYSKQIYDSWTSAASYASKFRGDKALKFFPEVDLTGAINYSAMFQESGILSTPPLTIGDGSNTVINSQWMFQTTPIEKIELTTSEATQKVQIANIFNGCTMLKNAKLTLSASGSMQYAFADCSRLERIEDGLETSDVTSFSEAFRACSSLLYLYELDLSSCTTCYRAFQNCTSLYSAPYLNNIRTGGNFSQMFMNCSSLRILPPYNLKSPTDLTNMFQGTGSNLEEASRINILFMLAGCTYSGTKTLAHLGFTASMYSAASWQALPNYNDFVSAGWSIGYN